MIISNQASYRGRLNDYLEREYTMYSGKGSHL
nr:MAG TPA: hypothetical protein [Caudoviricetes sp.]